jgi:hypothetical protein
MAEGRDRVGWKFTAEIVATILNVNRNDERLRWLQGVDIDPYAAKDGRRRRAGMPINSKTLPHLIAAMTGKNRRRK